MIRLVDLGEIFAAVARGFGLKVEVKYIHEIRGAPIDPNTGDHSKNGELEWWRFGKRCIVVGIGEDGE
jgi:hypothetical protein